MVYSEGRERRSQDNLFWRLESAEPYIAIRLLILQVGIAVAMVMGGGVKPDLPPLLDFFPYSWGCVVFPQSAFDFGYPIRELIWGGEIWRIGVGILLPPGLGLLLFAWVPFFPLVRWLEMKVSRRETCLIYLFGGLTTVGVDLVSNPGITSGGIGMVSAAVGAVWVLQRFEAPVEPVTRPILRPLHLLFFVLLGTLATLPHSILLALFVEESTGAVSASLSSFGVLAPSLTAFLAAGVTGMVVVLPAAWKRGSLSVAMPGSKQKPISSSRRLARRLVEPLWVMGLAGFLSFSWLVRTGIDHSLWRLEPDLVAGNKQAQQKLGALCDVHPKDLFLRKRLAVSYLRSGDWDRGQDLLESLATEVKDSSPEARQRHLRRQLRLADLNLRSSTNRFPVRFSGISGNYSVEPLRLAIDRAQLARERGDKTLLEKLHEEVFKEATESLSRFVEAYRRTLDATSVESTRLNSNSYFRAELDGDLAVAIEEASRSVALDSNANNQDTLGWIEVKKGNPQRAIPHLEEALFSSGGMPVGTTYYHMGVALDDLGEKKRAEFYFGEALRLDLEWWEERDLLARCPHCQPSGEIQSK